MGLPTSEHIIFIPAVLLVGHRDRVGARGAGGAGEDRGEGEARAGVSGSGAESGAKRVGVARLAE